MGTSPLAAWPDSARELAAQQVALAACAPPPWEPREPPLLVAGCFVCFQASPTEWDPAWAAAALLLGDRLCALEIASGRVAHPYEPGLLALREGRLLSEAVARLPRRPQVLVANATGRDHPRRAGLAIHLGAVLDLPSVGVTDRPLVGKGAPPRMQRGARSPVMVANEVVAHYLVTRSGARPVVVHAGWRTNAETALRVVTWCTRRARTPDPIRRARRAARLARAQAGGVLHEPPAGPPR